MTKLKFSQEFKLEAVRQVDFREKEGVYFKYAD